MTLLDPFRKKRDQLERQLREDCISRWQRHAILDAISGDTSEFKGEFCAEGYWRPSEAEEFYDLCVKIKAIEEEQLKAMFAQSA